MFEDAYLLDTEQWEWTPVPAAQAQQLQSQQPQSQDEQQEQQQVKGLLEGGALSPAPGFLVGHTAVLAASGKGKQEGGEEEEDEGEQGEGMGVKGEGEARVLVFGGQDRLGVRREELLVLQG